LERRNLYKGPRDQGLKGSSGGFLFLVFHLNPRTVRQAVRQAHGPEQSRRTHGPEQSRRTHGPEQSRRTHGPEHRRRALESLNPNTCRLQKNACDRRAVPFSRSGGHGCCFQDDISKRDPPKACSGVVFKGLLRQNPWEKFCYE
jgi:hypothetical protein